jgi:hypothetical protein
MFNRRVLIVIGGAGLLVAAATPALLARAESPAAGGTTTTVGPTTSAGGEFALPAGFEFLVDDTNRITIAVPTSWTDVSTAPSTVDGALVPSIGASTDLDTWEQNLDVSGVLYRAFPYTADPQILIDRLGLSGGCNSNAVIPYADGVFTGSWATWNGCGSGGTAWHLIVASPAGQEFTAAVVMQLADAEDQEALDVMLETFNVTASATWPASEPGPASSTTPAATTMPAPPVTSTTVAVPVPPVTSSTAPASSVVATTVAGPTTTVSGAVTTVPGPTTTGLPAIGVRVVDETNFLTVTVPADWTDRDISNSRHDDGSERARITASPDIQQYYETWEGSGTHLLALPPTTEPTAVLNRFAYPGACTDGGITPVDDGRLTGQRQTWLNCDGLATRVVNVAARPLDGSFTLFIQVQQATPDDTVLNQILASAGPVQGAVYPTPTAALPLTPTGPVPPELLTAPAIPLSTVTDDEGRLSISVPSTWTDTDGGSHLNDDATDRPRVAAAPVLDEFYSEWEAPGVQVVAFPFTNDPSTLLRNLGFADQCTDAGVQSFSNGTFTGLMQTWASCGDTVSRNVLLAVSPADQSVTVYIEIQLTDQDNTPLQAVLSSLRVE